jgi:hypothetical protein
MLLKSNRGGILAIKSCRIITTHYGHVIVMVRKTRRPDWWINSIRGT